ncbi:hypothetical protein NDU88_008586 [Pleurodeles waltl]|uniref:Uncharacterized protein n=1 Tax=Pleurodeles waltl TaxID=8319 RepID=A0AAV7N8V8_PLEWA|nr:hypothetical protein NDU88_008586 [Pleurodeles waltl]
MSGAMKGKQPKERRQSTLDKLKLEGTRGNPIHLKGSTRKKGNVTFREEDSEDDEEDEEEYFGPSNRQ